MGRDGPDLVGWNAAYRDQTSHTELSGRDGAGFIRAENIDPREGFDGLHLLHQSPLHRETADADDE